MQENITLINKYLKTRKHKEQQEKEAERNYAGNQTSQYKNHKK